MRPHAPFNRYLLLLYDRIARQVASRNGLDLLIACFELSPFYITALIGLELELLALVIFKQFFLAFKIDPADMTSAGLAKHAAQIDV